MRERFSPNRPIAHRGLHDARHGIIENTAAAFRAAIAGHYGIETDIQAAAGGEPVIFHDETLERLTEAEGAIAGLTPSQLAQIPLRGTRDRIMTLSQFLRLIDGRAPLFLEIKSHGGPDRTLEQRIAQDLAAYRGPVSVMSFDAGSMAAMRRFAPQVPRGLSSLLYMKENRRGLSTRDRFRLTHMLDIEAVKPDFLTYEVNGLAVMAPALRRGHPDLPIITWTVRTAEDRRKARIFADAMIFEGFRPSPDEMAATRIAPDSAPEYTRMRAD
jgi:glycerophosphoryl diester phosphodiesterase